MVAVIIMNPPKTPMPGWDSQFPFVDEKTEAPER